MDRQNGIHQEIKLHICNHTKTFCWTAFREGGPESLDITLIYFVTVHCHWLVTLSKSSPPLFSYLLHPRTVQLLKFYFSPLFIFSFCSSINNWNNKIIETFNNILNCYPYFSQLILLQIKNGIWIPFYFLISVSI